MNEDNVIESVADEDKEYAYRIEDELEKERRKKFNDLFYEVFNGENL